MTRISVTQSKYLVLMVNDERFAVITNPDDASRVRALADELKTIFDKNMAEVKPVPDEDFNQFG